jgi:hypothetical protein
MVMSGGPYVKLMQTQNIKIIVIIVIIIIIIIIMFKRTKKITIKIVGTIK